MPGSTAGKRTRALSRAVDRHGRLLAAALHPNSIGEILKNALRRAGYPDASYCGHSLRAGFATQAARSGASAFSIMRKTGHRSVSTVARYIREAELFRDTPVDRSGCETGLPIPTAESGASTSA